MIPRHRRPTASVTLLMLGVLFALSWVSGRDLSTVTSPEIASGELARVLGAGGTFSNHDVWNPGSFDADTLEYVLGGVAPASITQTWHDGTHFPTTPTPVSAGLNSTRLTWAGAISPVASGAFVHVGYSVWDCNPRTTSGQIYFTNSATGATVSVPAIPAVSWCSGPLKTPTPNAPSLYGIGAGGLVSPQDDHGDEVNVRVVNMATERIRVSLRQQVVEGTPYALENLVSGEAPDRLAEDARVEQIDLEPYGLRGSLADMHEFETTSDTEQLLVIVEAERWVDGDLRPFAKSFHVRGMSHPTPRVTELPTETRSPPRPSPTQTVADLTPSIYLPIVYRDVEPGD